METTTKLTFRDKAQNIFNSDEYFISVAALSFTLSVWLGASGYLLGISAVIIMLWANRWNLGILGLKKAGFITAVTKAILYSIAIFIAIDIIVQPFIEKVFGEIDISSLDGLRGNIISYIIFSNRHSVLSPIRRITNSYSITKTRVFFDTVFF